jgi:hypothetical protein
LLDTFAIDNREDLSKSALLKRKSVVVHFLGKASNPGCLLAYQTADIGGGPTDQGTSTGRGKMRKWLKTMCMPESTYHRETFPQQSEVDATKACFQNLTNPNTGIF